MNYKIILESFEGPFDLLFHLIEKSEVDIYDIPIAEITDQYIQYIKQMEELDLEVTSEFLVMAATLVEIKSKMLLPKKEEEGIQLELEEIDPREELIKKLIEYKKYKMAATELKQKEKNQKKVFFKPREEVELFFEDTENILEGVGLPDLIGAFNKMLKKHKTQERKKHTQMIERDEITIEESMAKIQQELLLGHWVEFKNIFQHNQSVSNIVVTFLAILELIKLKKISIKQNENFSIIYICLNTNSKETQGE